MTNNNRVRSGAVYLVTGELAFQFFGFLRNIIVARAIEPEDFGIASAIAVSVTFIEVLGGLEVGRFLSRKHEDASSNWLSITHTITLFRGLMTAAMLLLFSGLISEFMALPEYSWAFAMMAIVPALRAFINNSHWVEQRNLNFRPFVICQAVPQVVSLLLTFPVLYLFPDFRALLVLSIVTAATHTLLSHCVTRTVYSLKINKEQFIELWRYSFPLWFDGLLMFWVLQGERVIVSREFGPQWLGIYSAAFMLTWTPAAIASRFCQSIGVPFFSKSLHSGTDYQDPERVMATIIGTLAVGFSGIMTLGGAILLSWLFGNAYAVPFLLMGLLGAHYAFRIIRVTPTVLFLAFGNTKYIAQANLIRGGGVILAWWAAVFTQSIYAIFVVSLLMEFLASEWLFLKCAKISKISVGYRYGIYFLCILPFLALLRWNADIEALSSSQYSYFFIVSLASACLAAVVFLYSLFRYKGLGKLFLDVIGGKN
ncbi:oligosaccharide flippase family protein [Sneathiella glossodoripedis]|uniref:oligosaccharide flippase family protein n=1 Tax=Sneathiella glossodoripedis TaxID=418853 RepID=UPI00046E6FB0|nr:oligosaccharide flippase family protein [Sneathiella glossodoripedis]